MTNNQILKATTILLLATTIPFVGWSNARALDENTSTTSTDTSATTTEMSNETTLDASPPTDPSLQIASGEDPPTTITMSSEEHSDPEFKQALIKHHEKMFFKKVDATADQQTKISQIFADARAAKEPLKSQLHQQFKQMHELLASTTSTDQQITDKAHDLRKTEDELKDQRLDTMLKIRGVLSATQREQLASSCCGEGMGHKKGKHGGGGHWGN